MPDIDKIDTFYTSKFGKSYSFCSRRKKIAEKFFCVSLHFCLDILFYIQYILHSMCIVNSIKLCLCLGDRQHGLKYLSF